MLFGMARATSSWLSGGDPEEDGYPGQRLGLPPQGSGSIAGFGRRIGALMIDWAIAVGITALGVPLGLMTQEELLYSLDSRNIVLLVWIVLGVAGVRLYGFTPGQYALGLAVIPMDGRDHVGVGKALIRNLLIVFVIPALFTDSDHRGLHDLASKTAVVRR